MTGERVVLIDGDERKGVLEAK